MPRRAALGLVAILPAHYQWTTLTTTLARSPIYARHAPQVLNDMAQYPIFKDFASLIANKRTAEGFTESDSGRSRLLDLLRDVKRNSLAEEHYRPQADILNRHRCVVPGRPRPELASARMPWHCAKRAAAACNACIMIQEANF